MEALEKLFCSKMNQLFPKLASGKIAVAVSGGADSMALVKLAKVWADKQNVEIIGLTVDHKLRPESTKEANLVAKWLKNLNINHQILTWVGRKPVSDIEAKARAARYNLLFEYCKKNHISSILLAHQQEEQAETFLMRLERGSGVYGLSAMAEISQRQGINLVRPLLEFSKTDLVNYNIAHGQKWAEDPYNQNEDFLRVKMRKFLPQLAGVGITSETLAKTAQRLARAAGALQFYADKTTKSAIKFNEGGYAEVNWPKILNEPEEVALKIIANLLIIIGGNDYPPRFERLYRLYLALQVSDFKGASLSGCLFKYNLVMRESSKVTAQTEIKKNQFVIWDKRFLITSRESSLIIIKKIETKDLNQIKDLRIPFEIKKSIPCFYDNNNYLMGIGLRNLFISDKKLNIRVKFITSRGEEF